MSSSDYLSKLASKLPSHHQTLEEINDLYKKKLWFNITDKIETFVSSKDFHSPQGAQLLVEFYQSFLKEFELNLNLLRLAQIISIISLHIDGGQAIEFINSVITKIQTRKDNEEALVVLKVQIAFWKLKLKESLDAKKILEEAKELIDKTGYVDNIVHATYYKVLAEYYKAVDDPNEFYRSALLYLAYTPIENIQLRDRQAMAYDLGMAALLGDQIYNFGELLAHPVIESLNGTEADWLVKLLFAFNKGTVEEYLKVTQQYKQQIESITALQHRKSFLEEKMKLMAILELVFSRPADQRAIPFRDVAQTTASQLEFVEPMLLRALAYELIRGKIDEVAQVIHVTWVQPRVLDKDQIMQLKNKVSSWLAKVDNTLDYLQQQGSDEITTSS